MVHVVIADSQNNTVYEGDYDTNLEMSTGDIPVTGTGQETYTMYVDGNRYSTQVVDFGA